MHQLPPRVTNVCFKYLRQDPQTIRRIQDIMIQYEVSFKISIFLLPYSLYYLSTFQRQVEVFAHKFHLDACQLQSRHGKIFYGTDNQTYKSLLDEWFLIVE